VIRQWQWAVCVRDQADRAAVASLRQPDELSSEHAVNACFRPEPPAGPRASAGDHRKALRLSGPKDGDLLPAVVALQRSPRLAVGRLAGELPRFEWRPQGQQHGHPTNAIVVGALAAICAGPDPPLRRGSRRSQQGAARRSPARPITRHRRDGSDVEGQKEGR